MYSNFNFTEGAYKCPLLMFMYLSSLSTSHLEQLVEKRQIEEENGSTPPYCICLELQLWCPILAIYIIVDCNYVTKCLICLQSTSTTMQQKIRITQFSGIPSAISRSSTVVYRRKYLTYLCFEVKIPNAVCIQLKFLTHFGLMIGFTLSYKG